MSPSIAQRSQPHASFEILLVCLIAYAHLLQPSSAAAERVFSLLKNAFGEQQQSSLHDLVAATLMVQYNKRGLQ